MGLFRANAVIVTIEKKRSTTSAVRETCTLVICRSLCYSVVRSSTVALILFSITMTIGNDHQIELSRLLIAGDLDYLRD